MYEAELGKLATNAREAKSEKRKAKICRTDMGECRLTFCTLIAFTHASNVTKVRSGSSYRKHISDAQIRTQVTAILSISRRGRTVRSVAKKRRGAELLPAGGFG